MRRPPWLVVVLLVALAGTAGWAVTARRTVPGSPAAGNPAAVGVVAGPHDHRTHRHGGTAHTTPPVAPRDGVVAITVPELPATAVNFIWRPEHVLVAAGQRVTFEVANADYMQHNFTFAPAGVARNLPVDATTTIRFTAPDKPGVYRFYCKYHLQMMEGAVTVR